ncbi:MAG TPA: ATP-binding protein [Bacteroidales bacterium]|nr:MAG: hypothetical protein A2W98_02545 [Bacteroidetes bacterium GWF2_33_38]OFY74123.1 MAG: hypothetical protein A2265_05395 [Bacteroidetes bacterium RIFOXYA12_FULL_33_9]OFY89001.1 MAG: hypothetical protein A2236_05490 [Bacteroidetes bacterium RIFOXYA2_FULL_33_7]HBF89512.1 ATP-binding protein [Bacteroidales bacterium]
MIQELKIKNFLSFKEEVVFSFEATSDKTLEDYYVHEPVKGVRLLKMAMIYGANASGKSNLIKAFDFFKYFIFKNVQNKDEKINFQAFEFDKTKEEHGELELVFYVKDVKYVYSLELDKDFIYKEKLVFYPSVQPALIFDRTLNKNTSIIEFGAKIKISSIAKEEISLKTLKNSSVFSAYSQVNISIPELDAVYNWFKNQFMRSIDPYTNLTNYSDKFIAENQKIKDFALKFIKEADFNISDIKFKEQDLNVSDEMLQMFDKAPIPNSEKDRIKKERLVKFKETIFEHKIINNGKEEFYSLSDRQQSQGTMRYYGLSAPFYYALENDAFMSIDEIGSALHPLLVIHFIKEFLKKQGSAQLLFTTHNMSLLNEKDLLRKDAIWFTEKGKNGATELSSISDYPDFRKELSYYNYYKNGKFGAIPELG